MIVHWSDRVAQLIGGCNFHVLPRHVLKTTPSVFSYWLHMSSSSLIRSNLIKGINSEEHSLRISASTWWLGQLYSKRNRSLFTEWPLHSHSNISTTVKGSPIDFTFNSLSEKCIISLIAKLSVKHPLLSPVQTTAAAHHTGHEAAS